MKGRFVATGDQITAIGSFLDRLGLATSETGVQITGPFQIQIENESTISAQWDEDVEAYLVDDTVGD